MKRGKCGRYTTGVFPGSAIGASNQVTCRDMPVDLEQLASPPEYEAAPAAVDANQQEPGVPRTFAQIVAEDSYTAARIARQTAADLKRESIATKKREEKERRENRRKEEENGKENKEGLNDSEEEDNGSQVSVGGFSQVLGTPWDSSDWAQDADQDQKRPAPSPPANVPENKAPRITPSSSRSNSASNSRRKVLPGAK